MRNYIENSLKQRYVYDFPTLLNAVQWFKFMRNTLPFSNINVLLSDNGAIVYAESAYCRNLLLNIAIFADEGKYKHCNRYFVIPGFFFDEISSICEEKLFTLDEAIDHLKETNIKLLESSS